MTAQRMGRHENATFLRVPAIKLHNYFACVCVGGALWLEAWLCCLNADHIIEITTLKHTQAGVQQIMGLVDAVQVLPFRWNFCGKSLFMWVFPSSSCLTIYYGRAFARNRFYICIILLGQATPI